MQCIHLGNPHDPKTRCPLTADYIVLDPPLVYKRQPSPIWLGGERRTLYKAKTRPKPLYCRQHAYLLCGLEAPELTAPF